VVVLGAWLQLSSIEWAILLAMTALVWTAELLNTAIESVVDLASAERHPLAKAAKDTAAAGVLVAAVLAAVVGGLILAPRLWTRWFG
jgi:diacylglycerol kinase